jgi:hypothetical protein
MKSRALIHPLQKEVQDPEVEKFSPLYVYSVFKLKKIYIRDIHTKHLYTMEQ